MALMGNYRTCNYESNREFNQQQSATIAAEFGALTTVSLK